MASSPLQSPPLSPPLSSPLEGPESDGGTTLSTAFIAFVGGLTGGAPQMLLPTATVLELVGNTIMGAFVIAMCDVMILRQTLVGKSLRKGRMLLIVAVAFTLTTVTYRSPARIFQTIFDTAPDPNVRELTAQAYTYRRLGNLGYNVYFVADPLTLHKATEFVSKLPGEPWDASREAWGAYIARVLPEGSPLLPAARTFTEPQAEEWITTTDGRSATTVLLYDKKTNRALVHHTSG